MNLNEQQAAKHITKFIQAATKLFDLIQSFVAASFKIKCIFKISVKCLVPYLTTFQRLC